MTAPSPFHPIPVRLDFGAHAGRFLPAMSRLDEASVQQLDQAGIDPALRELVRIRASQINGCAYCVDMHTRDARSLGETDQRLHAVAVWREAPLFTSAERAALAFTEAVTLLAGMPGPDSAFDEVADHFGSDQVAALLGLIVTINAWNRLAVTTRAWSITPEAPVPA